MTNDDNNEWAYVKFAESAATNVFLFNNIANRVWPLVTTVQSIGADLHTAMVATAQEKNSSRGADL